jgi:dTDP-4-amino-4,6-dideoxygalactose transaminase
MTRDQLYFKMKDANVLGRRYFYPLISTFDPYRSLPSSSAENLPVATRMADEVICLPMHHEICREDIDRVIEQIVE